jgi:hypothetical protein
MARGGRQHERLSEAEIPRGTPTWIDAELIERTITVWQPYYAGPLTIEEAIAIIVGAGRILKVLSQEPTP